MTTPSSPAVPSFPNALETLDRHWAVKVVTPEDRAAAIQYGMGMLTRLGNGDAIGDTDAPPDFVVPLAGAYVIAAGEWLDFEGAASPSVLLSADQQAQRDRAHRGWRRPRVHPHGGAAARARRTRRGAVPHASARRSRRAQSQAHRVPSLASRPRRSAVPAHRETKRAGTSCFSGASSSCGLTCCAAPVRRDSIDAMELVASIREERPVREPAFLATVDAADETRMRFFMFTLFHLTEAATELLLFRLHGEPERVDTRLYSHFSLARDAAGGDSASRCKLRLAVRGFATHRRAAHRATRAAPRTNQLSKRSLPRRPPSAADEHAPAAG